MRLLFGSFATRHFHPHLMEHIRDRENTDAVELISNAIDDYNPSRLKDSSGSTLLHHAAREGNESITAYLVKLGFNVNALDDQDRTPLVLAVRENHVSTTEILLNANSDIRVKVEKGQSLVQSVFDGTIACYSHIIEMFMYKVVNEHTDAESQATALIETKCPLYYALGLRNIVITKAMLRHGCAVNDQEPKYGNSPLHRAVYTKDMKTVKLLLAHGADVNAKDKKGKIAWRCAPTSDGSIVDLRILKLLLDKKPVLKSLTVGQRMQMYELFVRGGEDAVNLILKSGIDVSGKDGKGDTVFHYLAMNCYLSGSKLSVDKSYNVDSRNNGKLSALHVAAINGNVGAMKFLLKNGASVDAKTGDRGLSPLMCAIRAKSSVSCIELLLERGADAQFVTHQGNKTVFDMIRDSESPLVKTLLDHLAMLESRGTTIVPVVRAKIEGQEKYEKQFRWFKKQLDKTKCDKVDESLTLFEILVQKKESIKKDVHDKLKLKMGGQNNNNGGGFDPYFSSMLKKRVKKAQKMVELFE